MKKPELLMPAGGMEALLTAVRYGADAVYMGGEMFSLRAAAKNFSLEDMKKAIDFAHENGVKVYVTANILAHNDDLPQVREYLAQLRDIKPDAILVADPGIFMLAREIAPEIDIHISTQANNTNYATFNFWRKLGATRIVAARELSLAEIAQIGQNIPQDMEVECFVHGAMCMSYSGRCLLSNYMTARDANKGACTHPCRWQYSVVEEKRPGEYMPVFENERGTYIFNSKDLCMIDHLPEMLSAGIASLKIEGRMKTPMYAATVARAYRHAIDDYYTSLELYQSKLDWYRSEMEKSAYREFSTGFYFGKPDDTGHMYGYNTMAKNYVYMGTVLDVHEQGNVCSFEQKNKFSVGDTLEVMKPDGRDLICTVERICDEAGNEMQSAPHPKQIVFVSMGQGIEAGDVIRKKATV